MVDFCGHFLDIICLKTLVLLRVVFLLNICDCLLGCISVHIVFLRSLGNLGLVHSYPDSLIHFIFSNILAGVDDQMGIFNIFHEMSIVNGLSPSQCLEGAIFIHKDGYCWPRENAFLGQPWSKNIEVVFIFWNYLLRFSRTGEFFFYRLTPMMKLSHFFQVAKCIRLEAFWLKSLDLNPSGCLDIISVEIDVIPSSFKVLWLEATLDVGKTGEMVWALSLGSGGGWKAQKSGES